MRSAAAFLLILSIASADLAGQAVSHRGGVWSGFGLGYGTLRFSCDGCPTEDGAGVSHVLLRAGITLSSNWLAGVEFAGWQRQGIDDDGSMMMLTGYLYPRASGNFFAKSGLGFSYFDPGDQDSDGRSGYGPALSVGFGVDLRATDRISLTPTVSVLYGRQNTVGTSIPGQLAESAQLVLLFSLGMSFH